MENNEVKENLETTKTEEAKEKKEVENVFDSTHSEGVAEDNVKEVITETTGTDSESTEIHEEKKDENEIVVPADERRIDINEIDDLSGIKKDEDQDSLEKSSIQKVNTRKKALNPSEIIQKAPAIHHEIGMDRYDTSQVAINDHSSADIEEDNFKKLQSAMNTKQIVYGVVMGCLYLSGKTQNIETGVETDGRNYISVVFPDMPEMHVYIKEEDYFMSMDDAAFGKNYSSMDNKVKAAIRRNSINNQIFARIPLLITSITRNKIKGGSQQNIWQSPYEYNITGSRKAAMEYLQHIWFFSEDPNSPHVSEDEVYRANVLEVWDYGARVECCGVESFISNYELTGTKNVDNAREYIEPGDQLFVKPFKLHVHHKEDINPETKLPYGEDSVYMSVSGRRYDTGYKPKELAAMRVNGMYGGIVASYNSKHDTYTVNLMNGVRASVQRNMVNGMRMLTRGDKVIVRVTEILDSYVRGSAKKMGKL